jgi:hypothetical protein
MKMIGICCNLTGRHKKIADMDIKAVVMDAKIISMDREIVRYEV